MSTQRSCDRRNELRIDFQMRHEWTGNRLTKFVAIVQTFEDSLRTFSQAFAFFIELTQNVQPRSFLRERPLDRGKVLRSEEHTSELQSLAYLVCRLLLEKK